MATGRKKRVQDEQLLISSGRILDAEITQEVVSLAEGEFSLNKGYARLAGMLARFKATEAWRDVGYSSFNAYLLSLQEKYGRSSKQLYVYIAAAEQLLPYASETDINRMGITKAEALARAAKKAGKPITAGLLAAALDAKIGVNELKGLAHQAYNLPAGELPKGNWFDFGGAYLTAEERKIFVEAVKIAIRVLDLPKEMPEWLQRKRVLLAFASEFDGTYRRDVYGPGVGGDQQPGTSYPDLSDEEGGG